MSESFKALLLHQEDGNTVARIQSLSDADLPDGDVLLAVEYSSLNYKDGLAVTGIDKICRTLPLICGIDLAGTVDGKLTATGGRILLSGQVRGDAAARCLVRSRLVATEPQWPRMNSTFSRSLRTRHSRVIPKISLRALRLLRFRPSSLPRFAASDDGHFAPDEPSARPCRPVMLLATSVSVCSKWVWQISETRWKPRRYEIIPAK